LASAAQDGLEIRTAADGGRTWSKPHSVDFIGIDHDNRCYSTDDHPIIGDHVNLPQRNADETLVQYRFRSSEANLSRQARQLLGLPDSGRRQLSQAQQAGLVDLEPVHLPSGAHGDCNHYGWPIATMVDDTIR